MKMHVRILGLVLLLAAAAANGAKVKPAYESATLPEETDESQLWERASAVLGAVVGLIVVLGAKERP